MGEHILGADSTTTRDNEAEQLSLEQSAHQLRWLNTVVDQFNPNEDLPVGSEEKKYAFEEEALEKLKKIFGEDYNLNIGQMAIVLEDIAAKSGPERELAMGKYKLTDEKLKRIVRVSNEFISKKTLELAKEISSAEAYLNPDIAEDDTGDGHEKVKQLVTIYFNKATGWTILEDKNNMITLTHSKSNLNAKSMEKLTHLQIHKDPVQGMIKINGELLNTDGVPKKYESEIKTNNPAEVAKIADVFREVQDKIKSE